MDDSYARYASHNTPPQTRDFACPHIIAHRPVCVNKLLEDDFIVTCGNEMPGGNLITSFFSSNVPDPKFYKQARTHEGDRLEIWFM